MFKLHSKFRPTGDQPQAIEKLTKNLRAKKKEQVLLGVTGSGKTFTMASVIEKAKRPVLIISPNKTLAAQLYQEFREFFPENAVHYFVSYYDYYQPEAYLPQTDTYIEKDAKINEEIDRLRHAATQDLLTQKDIIIVASVSCIYNLGSPEAYQQVALQLKRGKEIKRKDLLSHLTSLQYQRNDYDFRPGTFRVRGEIIDLNLVTGKEILRIELINDKIVRLYSGQSELNLRPIEFKLLYPAHFWVTPQEKLNLAIENIRLELQERLKELKRQKKLVEAQRLEQRTNYDLEMLKETGYCHGIENYSRHLEFRKKGQPPFTLLDYYPENFLTFIDESHLSIPQLRGMYRGDRSRKETLIDYGFRLPSALDNRPLKFEEFEKKINQVIYVSATPGPYEMRKIKKQKSKLLVEQLIRPTGLLEPEVEIRKTKNQIQDLIFEIEKRVKKKERVLALTLTKRLAEALADFLKEKGIKTQWLHAEVKTLERPAILKALREGKYDVLVGINLLREGLDLPEVSLIAILDADREGFLRNPTTLIQTMGRAARHPAGKVIMYADKITKSMREAIGEVLRRRKIQEDYNRKHHLLPQPIVKEIREWPFGKVETPSDLFSLFAQKDIKEIEKEMKKAARELEFERAAKLRDLIKELKQKPTRLEIW